MQLPTEALIYVAIFVGVLALVEGIYLVAFGKSISLNSRVNRRLDMLDKGAGREQVLEQLRKEMQQHMKTQSIPLYSLLADKAQKAAIAFTPRQLIMIMGLVSAAAFVALSIGTSTDTVLRTAISVAIGVGAVFMIEEQLPDAVELMVRSLRVGNPFVSSVQIAANEVQDPLGTELGIIADECAYGRDVGEALKDMAERLDMQDLRFLAVAVGIQQQSGGNLAEILAGLAQVIRARFRLFRRVKAITAEAQWSGKFLSGFPLFCLVFILVKSPDYYDEVLDHAWFIPCCFIVGIMLTLNLIVMKMITNIKV